MTEEFEKVLRVFNSCKTHSQLSTAKQYATCFFEKYKSEFDSISKAHAAEQIRRALDDTIARFD